MVNIGDKVIYRTSGVCSVEDIRPESLPGIGNQKKQECYVLRPHNDCGVKIFVPTDNETLIAQIHPILTPDQALNLLSKVPEIEIPWVEEMRARTNTYRDQLALGDRALLAGIIKQLYEHRAHLQSIGKKLYAADDGMLKKAEKLLFEELAFVLEMSVDDVAHLFMTKAMADMAEV